MTTLDAGFVEWHCPQCGKTDRTRPVPNRWHGCPKLKGISVQMLRKGVEGSIRIVEREDYVGNERVQLLGVDKRPVMSVVTEFGNGRRSTVAYAPTASAQAERPA